jgi:hypothetical protein
LRCSSPGNANSWQLPQAEGPSSAFERTSGWCSPSCSVPSLLWTARIWSPTTWQVTHPTPSRLSCGGPSPLGEASGAWQARQNGKGSRASWRWTIGSAWDRWCRDVRHSAAISRWQPSHRAFSAAASNERPRGAGPGAVGAPAGEAGSTSAGARARAGNASAASAASPPSVAASPPTVAASPRLTRRAAAGAPGTCGARASRWHHPRILG